MSLPIHSPFTTARPTTLTQAVAQARHPRNHATAQLEPHREELLRLRQDGESAESLVGGLRLLGIEIGRETMRRWLQQQLGTRPRKRRKGTGKPPDAATPLGIASTEVPTLSPSSAPAPVSPKPMPIRGGAHEPVPEGTTFILPGETPYEALLRRTATRPAADAAAQVPVNQARQESGKSMPVP